jgi:dCMP deaminase
MPTPFPQLYLEIAKKIADERSIDPFTKVGCVATNELNELIGASYNGFPRGFDPDFDISLEENREEKNSLIYHAEQNMILRHPRGSIHTLYLTVSPCKGCAKLIAGHGVKNVVYLEEYHRETEFKRIFDKYGVKYQKYETRIPS